MSAVLFERIRGFDQLINKKSTGTPSELAVMYKLLFLFGILVVAIAGKAQERVPVLHVDPRHAYGGAISEYFDNIEYLPLETKPESLFGDISKLIITDSSYIVCDNDTKSLLFFNSRGRYTTKIRSGKDVIPYVEYDNSKKIVSVCFIGKYDYLNDGVNAKRKLRFYRFSNTGRPIDTISVGVTEGGDFKGINLGSDFVVKTKSCSFKKDDGFRDSTIYLMEVYKGDALYKKLIPYNQKAQMGFCYFSGRMSPLQEDYTVINGETYAATPIEHKVYKITKDTAFKVFEIVFPQDAAVPKSILKIQDTKILDSIRLIARPPGTIYRVTNIFFSGNKLFFKGSCPLYLSTVSTSELRAYNFIYDTIQHKVVALERLTPDAKTSFLPVFDPRDGLMIKGIMHHNDNFYSYVSSLDMFAAFENNRSKNPQYSQELQHYFKTQNRKSNPVIVRMKLKE